MADSDRVRILVVDDLPEKILVYRTILEELGEEVVAARSGSEALKVVLRHDFAVILLDVNMPDIDGFETAALIRSRPKSAHTPIIFITAFIDEMRPRQGYAHGAVDYILAPVEPEILRAKVKVFVDLFRLRQQVERRAQEQIMLSEERAKRAAAEEANRCSAFLARASAELSNSLDLEATLRALARVTIPFLADLSIACVLDEARRPRLTEWAWQDSGGATMTSSATAKPVMHPRLAKVAARVLSSGECEMFPDQSQRPDIPGGDGFFSIDPIEFGPDFDIRSALVVPLCVRDKILGCLCLALGPSGRRYGASEAAMAEDLAWRAGIAVQNAILVRNIQEADHRKDEFLAMLAHELRNPLAPIRNAVELLRLAGPSQPELERSRDLIDRQLTHLNRLVDDLLDVSRITRGKIRLQLETVDVAKAAVGAVESSRPLIELRKHEFTLSLPAEPLHAKADPARLSQIISNLLNNAAKYTEEGGRIWLTVEREDGEAVMRVRDTGAGIPTNMLPRIFEPFTQVDQSLDRSQGGLGIGLTLVRRLVEMHGGRVEALSQGVGHGSEFVVRLPAWAEAQSSFPIRSNNAPTPKAGAGSSILVVDDNVDAANSLAMVLRLEGHEVRTARDGPTALAASQASAPDVVLLDIGLPGMDGYEVARRLRCHPDGHQMLMVAVTGYGRDEDRARSEEAGFDHHLVKPIDFDALRPLLNRPDGATSHKGVS
jgi:signal transduction histidine kinase/DNA-binding response OmpR family regulator